MASRGFSKNTIRPQIQQVMDRVKEVIWETPANYFSDKTSNKWSGFKKYVEQNRKWMRFCEDALTKVSFFLPGRWGDSGEIGEFVYGLGLVLQTLNDRALNEESSTTISCGKESLSTQNVKTFTQLLQHMQLFIELLGIKNLSNQNRWKLVLIIEFIKLNTFKLRTNPIIEILALSIYEQRNEAMLYLYSILKSMHFVCVEQDAMSIVPAVPLQGPYDDHAE